MPSPEPQVPNSASAEPKDPILTFLRSEPHRAYSAEDLVRATKPLALAKDPQKLQQALQEVTAGLRTLIGAGRIVEVASGLYKSRLFFDKEENIEHAFIGGMGNTHYRFRSPIFRINIGVLSLFFILDKRAGNWMVTVRDTTIGKDYSLIRRLRDGAYIFGSRTPEAAEGQYLQIEGKYIAKTHMTVTLSGEEVIVEDHRTMHGTRIDLLTREGLNHYREVAEAFLQETDPKYHKDPVSRGRFVLERLLQHHQNFETSFFGAVVDSLLLTGLYQAITA